MRRWLRLSASGSGARSDGTASTPAAPGATLAPSNIELRAIGVVRNDLRRPRLDGWEDIESRIELDPALTEAVRGVDGFSHLIVLTWLHLAAAEPRDRLSLHPHGDAHLPRLGVLALRVAGRPNPIGFSVCRLLAVDGNVLRLRGLDAFDGTPVLDMKPYLPPYDSVPDALVPNWARSS